MALRTTIGYLHSVDPLLLQAEYPIGSSGLLRIGREAERCQVILCRDTVSRQHCHVEQQNGAACLVDLDSTNGTYVNGVRIRRRELCECDVISLGKADGRHFLFSTQSATLCDEQALTGRSAYLIGRLADNDIALANDPTVSAHHARLRCQGADVLVEDMGSGNGTYVNGERIARAKVRPQDVLRIGFTELCVRLDGPLLRISRHSKQNRLQLQAVGLSRLHKQHHLLRNINLVIEPGEYVGVLGPSGAGKSTLLNALSGFHPATQGAVLLNGTSLYHSYDMFRHAIGYVPQDDIIHRDLSVERSLAYTAQMRLPRDNTSTQIAMQVSSVVETLGLSHVRQSPVARLSGGQRKRVSIGCELLTKPSIVFLDEPTSGLDPSTEEKLMKHFGQMAEQGQSVVITTHILYSLDLLHLVIIMARGRLVYFGPVSEVCNFFSSPDKAVTRPLEIFDMLEPESGRDPSLREKRAEEYERKYIESRLFQEYVADRAETPLHLQLPSLSAGTSSEAPKAGKNRIGNFAKGFLELRQFLILVKRNIDLKISAMGRLIAPLLTPLILGLLTGTIKPLPESLQLESRGVNGFPWPLSVPLMLTMTAVFLGTLSACLEISSERPIYLRERCVNLRIRMYVLSKLPYLFLITLVQCFIFVLVSTVPLKLWSVNVMELIGIAVAMAWTSALIGLFISSLDPSPGQNSVILAIVVVLPQLLLCGAMPPGFYGDMNHVTQVFASVLPARWGFEMMLTVLYQSPAWARDYITGSAPGHMGFAFGNSMPLVNLAWLALIGVIFYIATCFSLKRYDRL